MTVLAQHGWAKKDKIEQGITDGSIQGVIMSPRDVIPRNLASYLSEIRDQYPAVELLADPQFYVGGIRGASDDKINKYPHYRPGLNPNSFSPAAIQHMVRDTLDWQQNIDVTYVLSPTVIVNDLGSHWSNVAMTLAQESVLQHRGDKPLLISLVVGEEALQQRSLMDGWLNDLTQLNTKGFYFVVRRSSRAYRQQYIPEVLASLLLACYSLGGLNDYRVYCGYTDMVTMLLHAVGVAGTASGWYFNLRQFTYERFIPSTGGRTARPRYSSRPLLSSIYLNELNSIFSGGQVARVLSTSQYDRRFNGSTNPENVLWPDNDSTLHHWNVLHDISRAPVGTTVTDRLDSAQNLILQALTLYSQVAPLVSFSNETGPIHLEQWLDGLNQFRVEVGV